MAALAHGLPVISTEPAVPIPELQHGQNIWLVPAQSPQALALAAEQLWQDRPALQRLGEGARQLSLGFTWDAIARRHLEVYRGLE